ncbi:hypothetical protein [Asticcacaulis sp.]|uniref:hypothetical protein n=1 Tax=Asticcacaulis sp. TaxID=1872648 RepID=UPI003F7C983E
MQRTLAFAALALTFAALTACSAPPKSDNAMSEMSSSSADAMAPMASSDNMAMSSSSMSSDAMAPMSSSEMSK